MRIASFIGLRFLRAPRRDRSISVITWISGIGVALGVMALIVTISVMNGFRTNLFLAVTGATPHVRVVPAQEAMTPAEADAMSAALAQQPGVVATAPYFSRQVFLNVQGQYRMLILRGIDPEREAKVTEITSFLSKDILPFLRHGPPVPGAAILAELKAPPAGGGSGGGTDGNDAPGIILGAPLARGLGLVIGDKIEAISTAVRPTPLGPVPILRTFQLVGVFESGIAGNDEVLGFVDLKQALLLLRQPGPQGIGARLSNPDSDLTAALQQRFPGATVTRWSHEHKNVFQVMRLEKAGLFLILALILVVSFFNIISSIVMLVVEKREAIGVLKAIGATDRLIQGVFFMQGVWIGTAGTVIGVGLGLALCWLLATVPIVQLPSNVFPTANGLPIQVELLDLALISACSFLICIAVTLYPARQAARIHPVESLRFDL